MGGSTTLAPEPTFVNTGVAHVALSEHEIQYRADLPAYDVVPQREAELRSPVISANQVTVWAALRRLGTRAVGPYQALIDPAARSGPVRPEIPGLPAVRELPDGEQQQEGWT